MRSHLLTSTALAAVVLFLSSLSSNSIGVLATRQVDPLYAGAGSRRHGYRSDLAAAAIAHNNKLRSAAAARVVAENLEAANAAAAGAAMAAADSLETVEAADAAAAAASGNTEPGAAANAESAASGGPSPSPGSAAGHPECISIASTSSCAPWTNGYYINATELALVYGLQESAPDAAYWDKLVNAMTGGGDLQAAIWAEWAQCLGYHGAPIQYYRSYVCLTDIFFYSAGCNPGTTISPPLHPDVCDVYKESVVGLIQDPNACPSLDKLADNLEGAALQDVFDRRSYLLSADESCRSILNSYSQSSDASVWGVTADQNSCGFGGNITVARSYCDDVFAQFHQKPKCCDTLSGSSSATSQSSSFAPPSENSKIRTDGLQPVAAAAEGAADSTGGSSAGGPPVGAIVGGVFGGLAAIGGAVAGFAAYKKRGSSVRPSKPGQPYPSIAGSAGAPAMTKIPDPESQGSDYVMLPPGTRFVGILEFQPTNPDEMEVNEGDIIEGKIQYSDGWMKGYNHESQESGLFPSAVVKPLNS
ncbi:hypothetical protein BJ742DRAFT_801057 [Cladochytrium replicatum]|nr:hypothetical protein BJ742DRAFT_801057 [Cladochytrium replicatum]